MTSKNSKTLKSQSAKRVPGENVAGGCSSEPSSCNLSRCFPELRSLGQDNDGRSILKGQPCMPAEREIPDTHQHQQNGSDDGGKTPKGKSPTRVDNVCGNEYPGIRNREGGGGGIGDEGAGAVRKKRTWTGEEDEKLKRSVEEHGAGNWMTIERYSGLARTSKSCRLRWTNHLRPNLKKGSFSEAEERIVVLLHKKFGNKWSLIASKLPGRTDNEVKNFWHGRVRRCRKQYLDIYPPNLGVEESLLDNLNIGDGSHFRDDDHSSAATDDTSHTSQFSFVHSKHQPNPNICYTSENPFSISASPPQSQLLFANLLPVSSPHGLSSSRQPKSRKFYTTKMHPLPINTTQSQLTSILPIQLSSKPPPISKFLSAEQDGSISCPASSISSSKLYGSSLVSHTSSLLNPFIKGSPTYSAQRNLSFKQLTASSGKLGTSSPPVSHNQMSSQLNTSTTASPHSPFELKITTTLPPHSCLQVDPSATPSLTSSPICTSSTLELTTTPPPLDSLNNMSCLMQPYSLGFELPQSHSKSLPFQ